jgi:broad specificity phosphatase PhoE
MGKLYLVRHGETIWNRQQRMQGCSNDTELSDNGKTQAKALSERLKDTKIDMIFSSPLSRAYQTAKTVAKLHNIEVQLCSEFKEINFGKWEGLYLTEIVEQYPELIKVWKSTPHLAIVPEAETIAELQRKSMKKLRQLLENYKDKDIMVVSHGISSKLMILSMMNMQLSDLHRIRQDNTALNIFEYKDGLFDIITLNDICHLDGIYDANKGSFEMK